MIDTSIVPEVPDVLYALFDYGLTIHPLHIEKWLVFLHTSSFVQRSFFLLGIMLHVVHLLTKKEPDFILSWFIDARIMPVKA